MLTTDDVESAKPTDKITYLFDTNGLYIEITPNGAKRWRLKYYYKKKANRISLGIYPNVSLYDARKRAGTARMLLTTGRDPSAYKQEFGLENITFDMSDVVNEWNYYQQTLQTVITKLLYAIDSDQRKYLIDDVKLAHHLANGLNDKLKHLKVLRSKGD